MVIIRPALCISGCAQGSSELYRQGAARDYRVPEGIDRHSVIVANQGLGDVPLLGAVHDCSLEAPPPNLTKVSSDPDIDPKEEPFIQVGKRNSLPRSHGCTVVTASPSRRQSHFATMPYKLSGSRKQHSNKKVAVKAASHGPPYSLARTGSQERTSTLNPVRSYFHVDSISAAGIERLTAESISTFCFATKIHQAFSLVLALELRKRLTNYQKETQDCWDEYHRNEPVSHRHPTAFANAVVSAAVSFQLPHPDRAGPSSAPMEASDAPEIVQSANITTNDSVEPAATTLATPAPIAMPKAPLAAAVQQGPDISSVFRSSLSQLATLLLPARGRLFVPAPTVTEPESQQDDDPVLPAPVPIPKPSPLSIPSPGISLISSGNEASVVLALQAALALQEAKLTQVLAALAAQEARAAARVIPTADTTVEAAVDLSTITAQALVELLKRNTPKSSDNDGGSSLSNDSSDDDSYDAADRIPDKPKKQSSRKVCEERKQKLNQYLLKTAKTVRDDRTSFKRLAQNSDPKSSRTSYNEWIKQVKKCCQMLPEFDNLFDPTDPTFIGTISKMYADETLDLFLNSEVDNAMANELETYQGGCNKDNQTSGVHVLRYLQRRFAPVDNVDEQVVARRNLEALACSDSERMTH